MDRRKRTIRRVGREGRGFVAITCCVLLGEAPPLLASLSEAFRFSTACYPFLANALSD
jgi:hypothetical protein